MADHQPRCAVVIPTYNGATLTADCLDALLADPPSACTWSIVVVDDGSTEDTRGALARFGKDIDLVEREVNGGFAAACNAGAEAAGDCDHIVFLNNDTLPTPGWLDGLVAEVQDDPGVAAVGAKLLYPNGQVQHAGVVIHQNRLPYHVYAGLDGSHPAVNRGRDVTAVTAACLLVRREDFELMDGFDTAFRNNYEDVDLCLRLRENGRRIRYCPRSVVVHLESVTRFPTGAPTGIEASERLYNERWRGRVQPDDVSHYLEDGLISLSWSPHCPLTVSVAPELGVIRRDERWLDDVDRLLATRSRQVLELLGAQTRRLLEDRAGPPEPSLLAASPPRLTRVLDGTEHRLGGGGDGRLVSVVLPVKNGGRYLEETLAAVLGQSVQARLEIVAIDSGSSDDTLGVLERFGATAYAIRPADFDHGLTRNLLAEHAHGDVLVFLTQMARPVSNRWLGPLLAAIDGDPLVAGACSRLLPRPGVDPLTRRAVLRDLCGSPERRRICIEHWPAYERMGPEERRKFLNFHTVSTSIRAEALRRTPFRSVRTLGEDLLWAREVVESGWALVHEPTSEVHHSHPYTLGELFGRNVDDGVANRDTIDRSIAREEIVPHIRATVADDWSYLRNELRLEGAELEHWQLEAVLRRVTQTVGQWVGVNYETLPRGTAALFSNVAQIRGDAESSHGNHR